MLTAGYAAHMVADWFGLARVTDFRTRFEAQLWPGDTVTMAGELTDVDRSDSTVAVEADFTAQNDGGDRLISGSAAAELPAE
jgi:acyl dehydratase